MWLKSNKEHCLLNSKSAWLNHSMCCTSCTAETENKQSPYRTQPRSSLATILKTWFRSFGVVLTVLKTLKFWFYRNQSYFILLLLITAPLILKLKLGDVFGWILATSRHNGCYLGKYIIAVGTLSDWDMELARQWHPYSQTINPSCAWKIKVLFCLSRTFVCQTVPCSGDTSTHWHILNNK